MQQKEITLNEYSSFFNTHKDKFIRFAYSYLGEKSASEDIVIDSFVALWEKRTEISIEEAPAYTFSIVKNRSLNALRNQATHKKIENTIALQEKRILDLRISSLEACDPKMLFSKETTSIVLKAISKLKPKTREIFERSRYKDESYSQIAEEMSCSVKNVEYEISKALKILRKELKDYSPIIFVILLINLIK